MTTIKLQFAETDTVPDRVRALAAENGVDEQTMFKRLIVKGLDGHGLSNVQGEDLRDVTSLDELAERAGSKKPT